MKRKIKVRFHLGAGENYMKWRVEDMDTNQVSFICPSKYCLVLNECKLYNQKGSANKIYNGENKVVCAWIMCTSVDIVTEVTNYELIGTNQIRYNPRVKPNWTDYMLRNIDKSEFNSIVTYGHNLFKI